MSGEITEANAQIHASPVGRESCGGAKMFSGASRVIRQKQPAEVVVAVFLVGINREGTAQKGDGLLPRMGLTSPQILFAVKGGQLRQIESFPRGARSGFSRAGDERGDISCFAGVGRAGEQLPSAQVGQSGP